MNSEIAEISLAVPSPLHARFRALSARRLDAVGASASALLHIAVLIALLSPAAENRSGAHPSSRQQAIVISLLPEVESVAPMTPPSPVKPQELRPPVPAPTPLPAPKPITQPASTKPATQPAPAVAHAAPTSPQVSNEDREIEDVVGRIRDNWLEPPGVGRNFRCRLRIDYAAGGMITAVRLLQGCGGLALDDSVKRAIWKTQPLPLLSAKREAGSLEIDFTP